MGDILERLQAILALFLLEVQLLQLILPRNRQDLRVTNDKHLGAAEHKSTTLYHVLI